VLLGRKNSSSGIENRDYDRRHQLFWQCNTFYPTKLSITSPTSGVRSVGIFCLRTKTTEFGLLFVLYLEHVWQLRRVLMAYSISQGSR
jgi:hypothetical protein